MSETIHMPVMMKEVIGALNVKPCQTIVDATLGGGGHAMAILERILPEGRLIAFDADATAIEGFRARIMREKVYRDAFEGGRIVLVQGKFSGVGEVIRECGIEFVSGILADLGLSSDQLEDADRGFSFLREGPLDMRFDRSGGLTANDIVNTFGEQELARIFRDYGDVRDASRMAKVIISERKKKLFETTTELAECIRRVSREKHRSIHPATKVFQALRMAVNDEREVLEKFLVSAVGFLETGGRIAVLSFHSGEERCVKRIFQEDARGCVCPKNFPVCRCGRKARLRLVTKRAIVPSEEEIRNNPRARSAKLRVAERI